MAFRETIEAALRVKDAARFKASMESAARSVRKFGRDEEVAATKTELLNSIEEKLQHQTEQLTVALQLVARSVDNVGDQARGAAASLALFNRVAGRSGSNAAFMGKSWAFWKDRLSLTRSELMTTALTIGSYFTPAIIAMGSSFAYAAIGGGGVAAGGLSTLLFGLGGLATVARPVVAGLKQIKQAQDAYNVTVAQYGAASVQASRANAHLYAIIKTNGGAPAARAAANIKKLTDAWRRLTGPARTTLLRLLGGGLRTARALAPGLGMGVNQMAVGLRAGMGSVFKTLRGGEMRQTFRTLSETFDRAIGPGLRGATNLMVIFSRVIRATAPWVTKLARGFERMTANWRQGATLDRVQKFFNGAVTHFKAWVGLASELWRTLRIIFGSSQDEGLKVVRTLTDLVRQFNNWLQGMKDTGAIQRFWGTYNQLAGQAVWALQHPIQAINRWLPQAMDAIATGLATHAPAAAGVFIRAFLNSGAWAQLLTVAWFIKRFGFFSLLGRQVGVLFVTPFIKAFLTRFAVAIGIASTGEGQLAAVMASAGTRTGVIFGAAFRLAFVAAIGLAVAVAIGKAKTQLEKAGLLKPPGGKGSFWDALISPGPTKARGPHGPAIWEDPGGWTKWLGNQILGLGRKLTPGPHIPGHQFGGVIPQGGLGMVGEAGPELAYATPQGTRITPLRSGLPPLAELPNLQDKMHLTIYTSVQMDKREVARAVNEQSLADAALRGGRRRGSGFGF